MNEMGWEMKEFERGETGENNRREGGEMVIRKTRGRKWNEEMREWIGKMIQDLSRKKDHQTHHH